MHGQAPYDIAFHWVSGPPLPVGLAPEAREALIRDRIAEIFAWALPARELALQRAATAVRPSWDRAPGGPDPSE